MEVVVPMLQPTEFNFDSGCSSPYITAPSTPKRAYDRPYSISAPTSPTGVAAVYRDFNSLPLDADPNISRVPFRWEEKPGTPKSSPPPPPNTHDDPISAGNDDFAFDFSGQLDPSYLTAAEELFEEGKIRPLKPPPRLQAEELPSPRSPKSPKSRVFRRETFSPRGAKRDSFDPFEAAIEKARRGSLRERRNHARSLSPFRVSDILWSDRNHDHPIESSSKCDPPRISSSWAPFRSGGRKWRLKDLLLFRSSSEGRAATSGKDPLSKYSAAARVRAEEVRNSSFRSTDSSLGSARSGRKGAAVSAHELHYKANRAVSEELRKKTFLPYKQGLLGCLGFNPSFHGFARGFQS